ncbi:hypothetical protein KIPB_014463, partial [Kipferlia bialata]
SESVFRVSQSLSRALR